MSRRPASATWIAPVPPRAGAPRFSLFWILQLGGWGLFGAGMFVAGVSLWPVSYAAVNKASLTGFGFGVSLLLRVLYRSLSRRGVPLPVLLALALAASFGASAVWMAAHHLVLEAWRRGARFALGGFPDATNTIYFFFVLVAWSVLYFGAQAYVDLLAHRERLARAETLAHEARLRVLRLQLNPHFLFNALNGVSTLVSESRTAEANRMLCCLSEFLRSTLERSEDDEIPLEEEIDLARLYLAIEEIRFGERLKVDVAVARDLEGALVPPLILQPLVENAVRHGVLPRENGGAVSIVATRQDGWIMIGVHDDGPGFSGESGSGVGLSNTRARLAEIYGGRAELSLSRSDRGGLAASIRLPFRELSSVASGELPVAVVKPSPSLGLKTEN